MDGLKQRIIGALVLICLAIIFVPMLFDEPHDKQTTKTIEIPNKPPYPVMTIEQPKKPTTQAPAAGDNSMSAAQGSNPTSAPATSGTVGDQSADTANTAPVQDSGNAASTPSVAPSTGTSTATTTPPETAPAPQPTSKPQPEPAQPATPKAATPQTSTASSDEKPEFSQSLKGAWIVQLGSFGSTKNAEHLRDSVRSKGYPAYLQTAHAGGKTLTRVFSGPFVQKTDAEAAKSKLDKAFHIKSLVMAGDK